MKSTRLWIYKRLTGWLPESRCYGLKNALLRWAGAKIGKNVRIYSSATVLGAGELEIGNDVHIGPQTLISLAAPAVVSIGSHVDVGPQVTILTGSHALDPDGEHIGGTGTAESVTIGDGCWLGARSVILPGIRLAAKTVVAAGAIVTMGTEERKCLLAGVPGVLKKRY